LTESIVKTPARQFAAPFFTRFAQDESGQDIVEYALLAALVASGSIAGTQSLALSVANSFTGIQNTLTNSIPAPSPDGSSGGNGGGMGNGGQGKH